MIMNEKVTAALLRVNASADQLRGFGATDVDAMRDAIESGRVVWQLDTAPETYADWRDITQDAKSAGMLTFHTTPYGVLITDDTD
jgi:hypothetical protein